MAKGLQVSVTKKKAVTIPCRLRLCGLLEAPKIRLRLCLGSAAIHKAGWLTHVQ